MAEEVKVGDVVTLKSGGPVMTVTDIQDDGQAQCQWFKPGPPNPSDDEDGLVTRCFPKTADLTLTHILPEPGSEPVPVR